MSDYFYPDIHTWQYLESTLSQCARQFGYQEIRTPVLEALDVYRKLGDESDIIGKQMYCFADQKGDQIALRPEGTAGIVRAALEHHLITRDSAKFYYQGPMFRYERPQKGRYRQFHQFGIELFGHSEITADIEILQLNRFLLDTLGVKETQLEINFLGGPETRNAYRSHLVEYLQKYYNDLDDDSKRRLNTNPLRILDSKVEKTILICKEAPLLTNSLHVDERKQFDTVCEQLNELHIPFIVNNKLVRGLDYYNNLVFEITTNKLGSQSAISAGGRFDHLTKSISSYDIPAIGFSIGMERLISLIPPVIETSPTITAINLQSKPNSQLMNLLQQLRHLLPDWKITFSHKNTSLKAHLKKAAKESTDIILIAGTDGIDDNQLIIKSKKYMDHPGQHIIEINDKLAPFILQQIETRHETKP